MVIGRHKTLPLIQKWVSKRSVKKDEWETGAHGRFHSHKTYSKVTWFNLAPKKQFPTRDPPLGHISRSKIRCQEKI
jgi:hypothetical protein